MTASNSEGGFGLGLWLATVKQEIEHNQLVAQKATINNAAVAMHECSDMIATTRVHSKQIKVNNQLMVTASNRCGVSPGSSNATTAKNKNKTINQQQ